MTYETGATAGPVTAAVAGSAALSPRLRRLTAEAAELADAFNGHPAVHVQPVGVQPPERFRVTYAVPGLRQNADGSIARAPTHVVDITLPATYPREQPYCVPVSPVFHPNISDHVCIADHWSPSRSLVDVVTQIGQMLQFEIFNTRSPLNAIAAQWVSGNLDQVPVGRVPIEPRLRQQSDGAAFAAGGKTQ